MSIIYNCPKKVKTFISVFSAMSIIYNCPKKVKTFISLNWSQNEKGQLENGTIHGILN